MYAKRIQLVNYGPIDLLDITFPFEGDIPKPVLLVGENGSGKSILLSHIVTGLLSAKVIAYPETPEVEVGKDFEDGMYLAEIRSRDRKEDYATLPSGPSEPDIPMLGTR